ncbi:protein kinase domain-containing protein [Sphingobium algorifonticola]|uniref:non-specific serine/threonine protein kinase n=1 Tax=Sphingobium algorifonticola TaxID=2008318 RepID=A0A437JA38_9SPHN|nr:protein kinase [Sphingobium algorifonticola]RVT42243.1 HAMP domain-containing protein [Sphingobium algorifonticola]
MSAPTWIGRYRVEAAIGEGAMAHVYLAHDPSIDRPVAIKVLKPEYRDDAEVVHRFLAESGAAGMLSHSHIVTIYDVGDADGIPYIAMEHLSGRPLDTVIEEAGRISVERTVALAIQIADALAYAHAHGVIHRDVKPSNILICNNGQTAKLLDFGIARVDARDAMRNARDAQRTLAGQVMGTPRYMSPEQAMGIAVDARSDLFSLGALLYEMVTGKPAFPGSGLATLALQIAQSEPAPIATLVRDCPRGLRFIIGKLLAKKPTDRFADADALRLALEREQAALVQDIDTSRRGLALRFKLPLILAAASGLALAFSVTMVLDRQNETMTRMALTSGASMTDFVVRNVAVSMADNAGLPAAEQDWLPLQAFVESAVRDHNVQNMTVVDDRGIIRASGQRSQIGTVYATSAQAEARNGVVRADGIHFTRNVRYAGADFGKVSVLMDRAALDAAMARTRLLLIALSLFVVAVIGGIGYFSARQFSKPLRRLREAMDEAAGGNTAFRLSHGRKDEVGRLFDAFNQMIGSFDDRLPQGHPVADAQAMLRTRLGRTPDNTPGREAA